MAKLFTLLLFTISIGSIAQQSEVVCKDHLHIIDKEQRHSRSILEFRSNEFTDNYDLKYHRLEWQVDPNELYISGEVTSYFKTLEGEFSTINFDLSFDLEVSQVLYHGVSIGFTQYPENRLEINLPQLLNEGQLDSVSIRYAGIPPQTGFGSFRQATHNNYQDPIIWTLSEPYGAKDWWPCKQDLNDKIDSIDVIVTTPALYRVASNGLLINEISIGGEKIYHWKHRYPIPAYLIAIGVTNYAVYSDFVPVENGEPIEILNYVYPERLEELQVVTEATIDIMELFNELFGLYPFADEKYGHAQFGFGGGIEHQTMSFMGGWSFTIQAHELAHQWFGDKVTCGSWQDIWLNEGFATYLEGLCYDYGVGPSDWQGWLAGKINNVTSQPEGSVFVPDTTDVGRIFSGRLSYNKGAMLLHMLRWKMGSDNFFQGLRNYLEDPELAYGYARTNDLKDHLEQVSGQDLTGFFEDWYYGEGYPTYHILWEQDANDLTLTIDQTTSHASVDFFEMPIPIRLEGINQDTLIRLDHNFSGQEFILNIPFNIISITFDPDLWLVSKDNSVNNPTSTRELLWMQDHLEVFPNPVDDKLSVFFQDWPVLPDQIDILNELGQHIRTYPLSGKYNSLKIHDLPSGTYILQINTPYGMVHKQLVKN